MTRLRPVMRYHGGKHKLAPWIISQLPAHRIYVEPYGGAASVLMSKPRSYAEVYNDLDGDVVNVFRVLRDPSQGAELRRLLELTPFSRDEFAATTSGAVTDITDPIERARRTVFRSFAGFGSAASNNEYPTGFRASSNRTGRSPAMDWRNYPAFIDRFTDRLRGVVVENRDAFDVMSQHDTAATLFYVDPPYPHSTRNTTNHCYKHEMSDAQHRELADMLANLRGMVVLSGYRCELYDSLFAAWPRVDRMAFADGAVPRVESLWFSPNVTHTQMRLQEEASPADAGLEDAR